MPDNRDDFPQKVRDAVARRAGQRCSNPNCGRTTSGPHSDEGKAISIGVAAHISAASPSGPRYNPNQTPEDRANILNAIWLCQSCAHLVDTDIKEFTDARLRVWKRLHEERIKSEMQSPMVAQHSARIGKLVISEIFTNWLADGTACAVDFRVSNQGASEIMINAVEFEVVESIHRQPMGHSDFSAIYDLDMSGLSEYASRKECQVAQILSPGEVDRFGVVLSIGSPAWPGGWRLKTSLRSNVGTLAAGEIEVWLPRPSTPVSLSSLAQHYRKQITKLAVQHPGSNITASSFIKTEAREQGGYWSHFAPSIYVVHYFGPKPYLEGS